jgi:Asp-tRNA(Asn)/Glu-tRNA(Gln) amidotransferase A subunit family amidase
VSGDLISASTTDVWGRFRSRELSSVGYSSALTTRIEAVGAAVNAFGDTYFDEALEQARTAEATYASPAGSAS